MNTEPSTCVSYSVVSGLQQQMTKVRNRSSLTDGYLFVQVDVSLVAMVVVFRVQCRQERNPIRLVRRSRSTNPSFAWAVISVEHSWQPSSRFSQSNEHTQKINKVNDLERKKNWLTNGLEERLLCRVTKQRQGQTYPPFSSRCIGCPNESSGKTNLNLKTSRVDNWSVLEILAVDVL